MSKLFVNVAKVFAMFLSVCTPIFVSYLGLTVMINFNDEKGWFWEETQFRIFPLAPYELVEKKNSTSFLKKQC